MFDTIVVGAGFAGSVLARQLASVNNKKVLLVEKRQHIAGNCYDSYDENGVLVHKYGPHLFHTSNKEVFSYLNQFTDWSEYQHHVLAVIDGQKVPLPFNLNALEMLFPKSMAESLEKKLIARFGFGMKVPILELTQTDDAELKVLADFIYDKVFVNYTAKQWGCSPDEISSEVMSRVPVFVSRDDRYFQDTYQVVPTHGYTKMFQSILDHPNIHLMLNTNYNDIVSVDAKSGTVALFGNDFSGDFIFTGMIDELFSFTFGELPYRTIDFSFKTLQKEYFQEVATVNYPNNYDFTRITEFKWIHDLQTKNTTLLREYPRDYKGVANEDENPCYPVFKDENVSRYNQYKELAVQFPQITLLGRLAEYRYYDMDDMVARALEVFEHKFA